MRLEKISNQWLKGLCLLPLILTFNVNAAKLALTAGYYSLSAKIGEETAELANIGGYRFIFSKDINSKLDLVTGYTVLFEDMVAGDMSYGLDLGVHYFPWGQTLPTHFVFENVSMNTKSHWQPFIGLTFSQRQYQSVKSSYAGFGLTLGLEKSFRKGMSWYADTRFVSLTGSQDSTATEILVSAGIQFEF
jgi:hypothetical protein